MKQGGGRYSTFQLTKNTSWVEQVDEKKSRFFLKSLNEVDEKNSRFFKKSLNEVDEKNSRF